MGRSKNLDDKQVLPIKGGPLHLGDTVGVLGMGLPISRDALETGLESLKGMGFKTKVSGAPYSSSDPLGYVNSSSQGAAELHSLLADPKVRVVIFSRGGHGLLRTLPQIDFDSVKDTGKLVVGFSDVTALLQAVHKETGIHVIHGPMIGSGFAKYSTADAKTSVDALLTLLRGEIPQFKCSLEPIHRSGEGCEGRLYAGNLAVTSALVGTRWAPQWRGSIVVLEEINENPFRVHRMLTQLKLSGAFDGIRGLLCGHFSSCDLPDGSLTARRVFEQFAADLPCPVWWGFPLGHEDLNLPIPFGCRAQIRNNTLELLESPVLV